MTEFTAEQQASTRVRILHDAVLLLNGADINSQGVLELSAVQLVRAEQTCNPIPIEQVRKHLGALAYDQFSDDMHQITVKPESSTQLDTQISPLLFPQATQGVRVTNALAREEIRTVRDALVFGLSELDDIRNFGKTSRDMLQEAVKTVTGFDMLNDPTAEQIAKYCDDLTQVKSFAIRWDNGLPYRGFEAFTVSQIMEMSDRELAQLSVQRWRREPSSTILEQEIVHARHVQRLARQFAERFWAAKLAS